MDPPVRILFLADSHLGLDLPLRPRVKRRRRGDDFLANYAAALAPARAGEVDLVVHGGDVFDRSHPHASLAYQGLEPLRQVADAGVPVFVVPGNHERSLLPHARFARHPGVHVFDRPRTFVIEVRGTRLALAGFPYERQGVRRSFPRLLEETGWREAEADRWLLCLHQCVEGARVGPADFTFRHGDDVVRARDIPAGFAAVLSGHIHRHQVLKTDLSRRPLAAPVLYPGSIERTALAEMGEPKGFMILQLPVGPRAVPAGARGDGVPAPAADPSASPRDAGVRASGADRRDAPPDAGALATWEFRPLPARPMIVRELAAEGMDAPGLEQAVRAIVASVPGDAVLTIRIGEGPGAGALRVLSAARLRRFAPESMNLEIRVEGARPGWAARRRSAEQAPGRATARKPFTTEDTENTEVARRRRKDGAGGSETLELGL